MASMAVARTCAATMGSRRGSIMSQGLRRAMYRGAEVGPRLVRQDEVGQASRGWSAEVGQASRGWSGKPRLVRQAEVGQASHATRA